MKVAFGPVNYDNYVNFGINFKSFLEEVDAGECTEIYCPKILDYIPNESYEHFINSVVSRMRHGCELVIGGSDLFETAKQFLRGDYTIAEINQVIFGNESVKKQGQYSLNTIADTLIQKGLSVVSKNLEGNEMYIKVVRK